MGAVASLLVIGIDRLLPASTLAEQVSAFMSDIDLQLTPMNGMLSSLLFAGALHVVEVAAWASSSSG
jgi:CPA1 family monovalent cation:H+ antiporter